MALKKIKPDLKILLGVETADGEHGELSVMLEDASNRANFIHNLISYLNLYGFDGVSLDFKHQNNEDLLKQDEKFADFVQVKFLLLFIKIIIFIFIG